MCCTAARAVGCQGLPESRPPHIDEWDPACANAKSGVGCTAKCKEGFKGAYVSACKGAVWQQPSGACLLAASSRADVSSSSAAASQGGPAPTCTNNVSSSFCYPDPSICRGLPPGANPPDPNSTIWQVAHKTYDSNAVTAVCQDSLAGSEVSYCIQGTFSQPVGGCFRDPSRCYTPPALPSNLRVEDWPTQSSWMSGEVIVTDCVNQYRVRAFMHLFSLCTHTHDVVGRAVTLDVMPGAATSSQSF